MTFQADQLPVLALLVLVLVLTQLAGGYLALAGSAWIKKYQHYFLALSAGFLITLVIGNLIPEALEMSHNAPLYVIIGFGLLHFMEHTVSKHMHFGEEHHHIHTRGKQLVWGTLIGLYIHSMFDGLTLSVFYLHDPAIGLLTFFGVLLHKFPEGFTIASVAIAGETPLKSARKMVLVLSSASLVGFLLTLFITEINPELSAIMMGLAGGVALYIGATDLVPEVNHASNRKVSLTLFGGMILFWFIGTFLHVH